MAFRTMHDGPSGRTRGILRLRGGNVSSQAYSPGRTIAEQVWEPLDQEQYLKLLAALQAAQPTSLPGNLWSEGQLEFGIQVLSHKKMVLARPFSRLDSSAQGPAQQRFDALLVVLRELNQK